MKLTPSVVIVCCVFSSSLARAQDDSAPFATPPPAAAPMAAAASGFGATGQWVASMRTGPGSGYAFFHKNGDDWQIALHPAVDYFLTNRISIGGVFGYTHSPAQTGTTTLDFGARAGFNLDIASQFSIWPTAGIGAQWTSTNHTSGSSSALQIFAPFLYHPAQHVFVGIGPEFQAGLSGGDYTEYGVDFIIGGWLL